MKIPEEIKKKLLFFKRRYIREIFVKKLFVFSFLILFFLITSSLIEAYFYLGSKLKTIIFYSFISLVAFSLIKVVIQFLKYLNSDKVISDEEAAKLISQNFPKVEDKLLNLIQLAKYSDATALIEKAIEEKENEIERIGVFRNLDLKGIRKYLRNALYLIFVTLIVFISFDKQILTGSTRLIQYDKTFYPPPPYEIEIVAMDTLIEENGRFEVKLRVKGEKTPDRLNAYLLSSRGDDEIVIPMTKEKMNYFALMKEGIYEPFYIAFGDMMYRSRYYHIEVIKRPRILSQMLVIVPPKYLERKNDTLYEIPQELVVLRGSKLLLFMKMNDTYPNVQIDARNKVTSLNTSKSFEVGFTIEAMNQDTIAVLVKDRGSFSHRFALFSLLLVQDNTPFVTIQFPPREYSVPDYRIVDLRIYAKDDYEVKSAFLYYKTNKDSIFQRKKLETPYNAAELELSYPWDVNSLWVEEGEAIEYYVEVYDNDLLFGPKKARTEKYLLKIKTEIEKKEEFIERIEEIKDTLNEVFESLIKETKEYNDQYKKLIQDNNLTYNKKKFFEKYKEHIGNIETGLKDIEEKLNETISEIEKYSEYEEYKEAYRKIKDDIKKLRESYFQKLLEMFKRMDYSKMDMSLLEEIQNYQDNLQLSLERIKNLLEKYLTLQELENIIENLNHIKEQKKEIRDTYGLKEVRDKLDDKIDELKMKEEDIKEKLDSLLSTIEGKLNKNKRDSIEKTFQNDLNILEQLKRDFQRDGNMKDLKKGMNESIQNTDDAIRMLSDLQREMDEEEDVVNYETLRNLIENLIALSMREEKLLSETGGLIDHTDVRFSKKLEDQIKIKDNFEIIRDSLISLSKRVIQIEDMIFEKIKNIEKNMENSERSLKNRNKGLSLLYERQTMASLNELSDMLISSLDNLRSQIQMKKNGSQSCQNPKQQGSGMSLMKIAKQQQMLNQMLEEMLQRNQKGKLSESDFEKMAREQERIRDALNRYYERMKEEGRQGLGDLEKIAEMMKQTENELLDKILNEATMKRQYTLLNRLLDYDKAMREREYEQRRESETAKHSLYKYSDTKFMEQNDDDLRKRLYEFEKMNYREYYRHLIDLYSILIKAYAK